MRSGNEREKKKKGKSYCMRMQSRTANSRYDCLCVHSMYPPLLHHVSCLMLIRNFIVTAGILTDTSSSACREHPLIFFFVFDAHRILNTHRETQGKSDQMFLSVWVNFCSVLTPPVDVCLRLFHMISFPSLHPEPFFCLLPLKAVVCGSLSVSLYDCLSFRRRSSEGSVHLCIRLAPLTVVVPRDNCIFFRVP